MYGLMCETRPLGKLRVMTIIFKQKEIVQSLINIVEKLHNYHNNNKNKNDNNNNNNNNKNDNN